MTIVAAPAWRPLDEGPLFIPELLQDPAAIPDDLREVIVGYLTQVAAARQAPLHTCTAFNALHFGYDLTSRGYRADVLDPSQFTALHPGAPAPGVLPVGAFVRIDRGGQRELWAEVAARWGAPPGVEADGWVPPELSGAPIPAPGDRPAPMTERLVLDLEAFGAPLSPAERSELNRLRRRGTLLDTHGHLTRTATYQPGLPDARDEVSWYVRHLMTTARPLLAGGALGGLLTDPDDDQLLEAALRQALATVDTLLDRAAGLRRWQDYAISRDRFARHRAAGWPGLPPAAVDDVIRDLARGGPQPRHTAVWPLLAAHLSDDPPDDPLELTAAAEVVTCINLVAADLAASADAGMLPSGTHLRVDDTWLAGGVWRSQRLPVPIDVLATSPLTPLGLGHLPPTGPAAGDPEALRPGHPPAGSATPPTGEPDTGPADAHPHGGPTGPEEQGARDIGPGLPPAPELPAAGTDEHGAPVVGDAEPDVPAFSEITVSDTLVVYTVALRETQWSDDLLPIPAAAAAVLADGPLLLELHHPGEVLDDAEQFHEITCRDGMLRGITWPWSFYAGIKITVGVPRGGRRLSATTVLLDEPLPFGDAYRWAADQRILAAALGLPVAAATEETAPPASPPGPRGEPERQPPSRGVDALRHLILSSLRRHGSVGAFGSRKLTGPQLFAALFGPDLAEPRLLWQIIKTCDQLVEAGVLTVEPAAGRPDQPGGVGPDTFVWWPDDAARRHAEHLARRAPAPGVLTGRIREHWVPPFCRVLPPGWQASDKARTAYATWIRKTRGPHADPELPDGYTFVRGGPRGSLHDGSWVQLASEALERRRC